MGKDHELVTAAKTGNLNAVEKILVQKAKRTGPLARWERVDGSAGSWRSGDARVRRRSGRKGRKPREKKTPGGGGRGR